MRDFIFSAVIWATWLLAPAAVIVLLVKRRFRTAIGFVAFAAVTIAFFAIVLQISDRPLRTWLGIPAAMLLVMLSMSGIWLCRAAWSALHGTRPEPVEDDILKDIRGPWITRRRIAGLTVAVVGAVMWVYRATHPDLARWDFLTILATYSCIAYGSYLAASSATPPRNDDRSNAA